MTGAALRRRAAVAAALVAIVAVGALAWPRLFPGPVARARAALGRGDWAAAAELARAHLAGNPDDPEALRVLSRASRRLGQPDGVLAMYGRLGVEPLDLEDLRAVAEVLLARGRRSDAAVVLSLARARAPEDPALMEAMARVHIANAHPVPAAELARTLAARPGWEARGLLLLGLAGDEKSEPAAVADALGRALQVDPNLTGAAEPVAAVRTRLARALLVAGRPAEAESALAPLGADPPAAWLRSRARLQRDDLAGALAARRDAGPYHPGGEIDAHEPAPYLGSARCAECHGAIHRAQRASRHAKTFRAGQAIDALPLPDKPFADPVDTAVVHAVAPGPDGPRWTARVGDETLSALVAYAFGSGDRGATPVGRDAKGYHYELRLSYYGDPRIWDVTTGQPRQASTERGYLGQLLGDHTLQLCFECHTTDARAARTGEPPLAADAIGCERCHGPGGHHVHAISLGYPDPAISRPRLADPAQVTALCAECHTPKDRTVSATDRDSIRFQGATLTWSRCYTATKGALGCTTCHDPHHDAATTPATYEATCLACHAKEGSGTNTRPESPARLAALADAPHGPPCPVNSSTNCIACHMPRSTGVMPHTAFTDHHIRIHREDRAAE